MKPRILHVLQARPQFPLELGTGLSLRFRPAPNRIEADRPPGGELGTGELGT